MGSYHCFLFSTLIVTELIHASTVEAAGISAVERSLKLGPEYPVRSSRQRREVPSSFDLAFDVLDPYYTEEFLLVGQRVKFRLNITVPQVTTLLNVSVFLPHEASNVLSLGCDVSITNLGSNFEFLTLPDIERFSNSDLTYQDDSFIIDFGYITNSGSSPAVEDNLMQIEFSVRIENNPDLECLSAAVVSATVEYDFSSKRFLWIGDRSFVMQKPACINGTDLYEPIFELVGPGTLLNRIPAVWTLNVSTSGSAFFDLRIEVAPVNESADFLQIERVDLISAGDSFSCLNLEALSNSQLNRTYFHLPSIAHDNNASENTLTFQFAGTAFFKNTAFSVSSNYSVQVNGEVFDEFGISTKFTLLDQFSLGANVSVTNEVDPSFLLVPQVSKIWGNATLIYTLDIGTPRNSEISYEIIIGDYREFILKFIRLRSYGKNVVLTEDSVELTYIMNESTGQTANGTLVLRYVRNLGLAYKDNSSDSISLEIAVSLNNIQTSVFELTALAKHVNSFTAKMTVIQLNSIGVDIVSEDVIANALNQHQMPSIESTPVIGENLTLYDDQTNAFFLDIFFPVPSVLSPFSITIRSNFNNSFPYAEIVSVNIEEIGVLLAGVYEAVNPTVSISSQLGTIRYEAVLKFSPISVANFDAQSNVNDTRLRLSVVIRANTHGELVSSNRYGISVEYIPNDSYAYFGVVTFDYVDQEVSSIQTPSLFSNLVDSKGTGVLSPGFVFRVQADLLTVPGTTQNYSFSFSSLDKHLQICRVSTRTNGNNVHPGRQEVTYAQPNVTNSTARYNNAGNIAITRTTNLGLQNKLMIGLIGFWPLSHNYPNNEFSNEFTGRYNSFPVTFHSPGSANHLESAAVFTASTDDSYFSVTSSQLSELDASRVLAFFLLLDSSNFWTNATFPIPILVSNGALLMSVQQNQTINVDSFDTDQQMKRISLRNFQSEVWYHLLYDYDASIGITKIYIDAELVANFFSKVPFVPLSQTLELGPGNFSGKLCCLQIYNRSLEPSEVFETRHLCSKASSSSRLIVYPSASLMPSQPSESKKGLIEQYQAEENLVTQYNFSVDSLVGFWPLTAKYTTSDGSGNGHPIIVNGGVAFDEVVFLSDELDSVAIFPDVDGISPYLKIFNDGSFDTDSFSFLLYLKREDNGSSTQPFLAFVRNNQLNFYLSLLPDNKILARYTNSISKEYAVSTTSPGDWMHIAYTHDKTEGIAKLYINQTDTGAIHNVGNINTANSDHLFIGTNTNDKFNGQVGCLQIYSKALTLSEIQEATGDCRFFHQGGPPSSYLPLSSIPGLLGFWPLTDQSRNVDQSGLENHAIEFAGSTYSNIDSDFVFVDSAALFPGTIDAGFLIPNSGSFDLSSFTIAFTAKLAANIVDMPLVEWGDPTSNDRFHIWFSAESQALKIVHHSISDGNVTRLIELNDTTEWFTLAYVYNFETGYAASYLNGRLADRFQRGSGIDTSNHGDIYLGVNINKTGSIFNGYMSCVQIYNVSLNPADVVTSRYLCRKFHKDWPSLNQGGSHDKVSAADILGVEAVVQLRNLSSVKNGGFYSVGIDVDVGKDTIIHSEHAVIGSTSPQSSSSTPPVVVQRKQIFGSTVTRGGGAVFALDVYVPSGSFGDYATSCRVKGSDSNLTKAIIFDFRLTQTGYNIPCVNGSTLTTIYSAALVNGSATSNSNNTNYASAEMALGTIISLASDGSPVKHPFNRFVVECAVYVSPDANETEVYVVEWDLYRDSALLHQNYSGFQVSSNISAIEEAPHIETFLVTGPHENTQSEIGPNFVTTWKARIYLPPDSTNDLSIVVEMPIRDDESLLTIEKIEISEVGKNVIGGQQIIDRFFVEYIQPDLMPQNQSAIGYFGVVTNGGTSYRDQWTTASVEDDAIEISFDTFVADHQNNTHKSKISFTPFVRYRPVLTSNGTNYTVLYSNPAQIQVIDYLNRTPSLDFSVLLEEFDPRLKLSGDTIKIKSSIFHTKESSAAAYDVTCRFKLPFYTHYNENMATNSTEEKRQRIFYDNETNIVTINFRKIFFFENITVSFLIVLDSHKLWNTGQILMHTVVMVDLTYWQSDNFINLLVNEFKSPFKYLDFHIWSSPVVYKSIGIDNSTSILDCQFTSSGHLPGYEAHKSRPNSVLAWRSLSRGPPFLGHEFLQISLTKKAAVDSLFIYPDANDSRRFVKSFIFQYSDSGVIWKTVLKNGIPQVFLTNFDEDTVTTNDSAIIDFSKKNINGKHFRIIPKLNQDGCEVQFSIRFDVHGYLFDENENQLPESCAIKDEQLYELSDRMVLAINTTGQMYVCQKRSTSNGLGCFVTYDWGSSWFEIDSDIGNIVSWDAETEELYAVSSDAKHRMLSRNKGYSWEYISVELFEEVLNASTHFATDYPYHHNLSTILIGETSTSTCEVDKPCAWKLDVNGIHTYKATLLVHVSGSEEMRYSVPAFTTVTSQSVSQFINETPMNSTILTTSITSPVPSYNTEQTSCKEKNVKSEGWSLVASWGDHQLWSNYLFSTKCAH